MAVTCIKPQLMIPCVATDLLNCTEMENGKWKKEPGNGKRETERGARNEKWEMSMATEMK